MFNRSQPERDAKIIAMRKAGQRPVDIAKEFNITAARVTQICSAAALAESKAATTAKPGQR